MDKIADKSKDKQKKYKATIITILWFSVIFFKQSFFLTQFVMWIIFLQNVQLMIEFVREKLDIRWWFDKAQGDCYAKKTFKY